MAISGHPWPSVAIRGHQRLFVVHTGVMRRNQGSSAAISGHQWGRTTFGSRIGNGAREPPSARGPQAY